MKHKMLFAACTVFAATAFSGCCTAAGSCQTPQQREVKYMKLASPISEGAVLQREKKVLIWGMAQPGHELSVTLGQYASEGRVATSGRFEIWLPPMKAGGPFTLKVTDKQTNEQVVVPDVLVGEVWFGSGQSNMQWFLKDTRPEQVEELIGRLNGQDRIRLQMMPWSKWKKPTPEVLKNFSATGIWFVAALAEKLDCPIGFMNNGWGGTGIQTWISNPEIPSPGAVNFFPTPADDDPAVNAKYATGCTKDWKSISFYTTWIAPGLADHGACWFRKTVSVPADWSGKDLVLRLPSGDKQDVTFFNGTEIGRTGGDWSHAYWNQPRTYVIPANLVKAGENEIAIRVYTFCSDGGFPKNKNPLCIEWKSDPAKRLDLDPADWKFKAEATCQFMGGKQCSPGALYEFWTKPYAPYTLRGILWYQGCDDTADVARCKAYALRQDRLIRESRALFRDPELPFIVAQLADWNGFSSFEANSLISHLRNEQLRSAVRNPGVGLISLIDTGDGDCHVRDKKTTGYRFARYALVNVYKLEQGAAEGPLFESVKFENGKAELSFKNSNGLHFREDRKGTAFYLAGADRIFYPADQEIIQDGKVIVFSSKVPAPVAVRYAWAARPMCHMLFNSDGLCCAQFRTDDWFENAASGK